MAFGGLMITSKGRNALANSQLSGKLEISHVAIGDGKYTGSFNDIKKLVNELITIKNINVKVEADACIVEADLTNFKLNAGYYLREIGIFVKTDAGEILYAYDNAGVDAEYIPSNETAMSVEKRLRFTLQISNVEKITASTQSVLYLPQLDFEKHVVEEEAVWNIVDKKINQLSNLIDGGNFIEANQVTVHNLTSMVHSNMTVDGGAATIINGSITTLEEHGIDENAHQNIIIDGNKN